MTQALNGFGAQYSIHDGADPGAFVVYGDADEMDLPTFEVAPIDVTSHASPGNVAEFIAGTATPGEMTVTLFWVPGGTQDLALQAMARARTVRDHRITLSNGATVTAAGFISSIAATAPKGDAMRKVITIKLSGGLTVAAGA